MNTTTWVAASITLATFGFINLVLFITLSSPFGYIMDTIDNQSERMNVSSNVSSFTNTWRTIFGMSFTLSMIGLIIWFLLGAHREEYEEY